MADYKKDEELNHDSVELEPYEPERMMSASEMQEYMDGSEPPPSFGETYFNSYKGLKKSAFFKAYARGSMKGNWDVMLIASIVYVIMAGIIQFINVIFLMDRMSGDLNSTFVLSWGMFFLLSLTLMVINWGYQLLFLGVVRRESPAVSSIFNGFNKLTKIIGVTLIMNITCVLGLLLFIVPGVMIYYRWCLSNYIIKDNPELSVTEVLKHSADMMFGYKKKLFYLHLSFIGWFLLSALTCGLLCFYVTPYVQTTVASFYEDLKSRY